MHNLCSTEFAVILLGIKDEFGVFRFPIQLSYSPGLIFKTIAGQPINPQIVEVAEKFLGETALGHKMSINQEFSASIELLNGQLATLYTGTLNELKGVDLTSWSAMSPLLRKLTSKINRVSYMRALQVFAGGYSQQDTLVFEGDEATSLLNDISKH